MTTEEITGPSLQAPTLPRNASQIDSYLLLSTQGGPGERGPRGTPGVRGPRGDPVSHALGLSRGHTEARAEHRFTGPATYAAFLLSRPQPSYLSMEGWSFPGL